MTKAPPPTRADFRHFVEIQTRWSDNDMFGHVNNVQYYRFFEVAVVDFLMGPCALDLMAAPVIPFAAESRCRFFRPLSWPETVTAGIRIEKLGRTSVTYGIGLFGEAADQAAAEGHWVHVFVNRDSLGFMLELMPQSGADDRMAEVLISLYSTCPPATGIQFHLFASPHIREQLRRYANLRVEDADQADKAKHWGRPARNDNLFRRLARQRVGHLDGALQGVVEFHPFRPINWSRVRPATNSMAM